MPAKQGERRRATLLLLGLGILLFSGYAITLRGRHLEPRKAVHLLGERELLSGGPAAFRLVAWDLKREVPLQISRVNLGLSRPPTRKAALARRTPNRAVVHLNVRIPDWTPGPAVLRAEVESELGPLVLESRVLLDPGWRSVLRLVPPDRELRRSPVLLGEGSGRGREPLPRESELMADRFDFFPAGGRLTSTYATRLLIRVLDPAGRPVPGELQVDDQKPRPVDPDGFVEVSVAEGRVPRKLRLAFRGETGRLSGDVLLAGRASQLDLAVDRILLQSGESVGLHLRSLASSQTVYLEAWWPGGWCHTSEIELSRGRANGRLNIPSGVRGPLLIRVRGDPFGLGPARRRQSVMVAAGSPPTREQALARLRRVPAGAGFWESVGRLSAGERMLAALLSRLESPEGPLPELADGSQAERALVAGRKSDLQRFGLGLVTVVSVLAWLAVAWLLFGQVWRTRALGRRRSFRTALLALAVVTLGLAGGWVWLYWGS